MRCERFREAISASMDGEDPGVPKDAVEAHLAKCWDCRPWATAFEEMRRTNRLTAAESVPDLASRILTTAAGRGLLSADPSGSLLRWRWALASIAVVQLAIALPSLFLGYGADTTVHLAREIGSWDVALAVGFLFAAWRPARAWGMVPLVTALVGCLLLTSAVDMNEGHARLTHEVTHVLEVVGLGVLWALARRPSTARQSVLHAA